MYCPQCGAANDDSAATCSQCGLNLATYREQWQDSGSRTADQGQPASQQPAYQQPGYQQPPYQQAPYQQYQPAYGPPPYQVTGYQAPQYRPGVPYGGMPRIPSYLGWAIAVLILCFWPTGIAAVVFASRVDNQLIRGDIAGAQESSRKAKTWCWITFGIGVGLVVLGIISVIIVLLVAASTASSFTY